MNRSGIVALTQLRPSRRHHCEWTPPPHIVRAALAVLDSPESWSCPPGHSGLWRRHLEELCDGIEAGDF